MNFYTGIGRKITCIGMVLGDVLGEISPSISLRYLSEVAPVLVVAYWTFFGRINPSLGIGINYFSLSYGLSI